MVPLLQTGHPCPALSRWPRPSIWFSDTGLSPSLIVLPTHSPNHTAITYWLFRFRSPLLTKSRLISFLGVLRCFSSPGLPQQAMNSLVDSRFFIYWVSPFGYLGLNASYRLIQAFRRLARPSSPLIAKASTLYA